MTLRERVVSWWWHRRRGHRFEVFDDAKSVMLAPSTYAKPAECSLAGCDARGLHVVENRPQGVRAYIVETEALLISEELREGSATVSRDSVEYIEDYERLLEWAPDGEQEGDAG